MPEIVAEPPPPPAITCFPDPKSNRFNDLALVSLRLARACARVPRKGKLRETRAAAGRHPQSQALMPSPGCDPGIAARLAESL